MKTDEELLLEYQRGPRGRSEKALADLFAHYREPLFGFFFRRVGDRGSAEDLVQETFLAVMRARDRYEPRAPVRSICSGSHFGRWLRTGGSSGSMDRKSSLPNRERRATSMPSWRYAKLCLSCKKRSGRW